MTVLPDHGYSLLSMCWVDDSDDQQSRDDARRASLFVCTGTVPVPYSFAGVWEGWYYILFT